MVVLNLFLLGLNLAVTGTFQQSNTVCDKGNGNPDLYGIGIRVSIYFQGLFTVLIQIYSPQNLLLLRPTNAWFLLALFIVSTIQLRQPESNPLDVLMILMLSEGIIYIINSPLSDPHQSYLINDTAFSDLCRLLLWAGWNLFAAIMLWTVFRTSVEVSTAAVIDPHDCLMADGLRFILWATLDVLEWCQLVRELVPQVFVMSRIFYLIVFGEHIVGNASLSSSCGDQKAVTKVRVLLDCFFVFPLGQIRALIIDVSMLSFMVTWHRLMRRGFELGLEQCMDRFLH